MIELSAVVITLNEEKKISRCLDSLQKVADEIVVVDSYSTDKTQSICESYGVRFIQHKFEGHIGQKNFALTQARFNHILSLDADECLSEELLCSINEVKNNWKYDTYAMNRLNNFCGQWMKHSGWYPDRKLRLFDKAKGAWGGSNPHDQWIPEPGASKCLLKGDILHYSYSFIHEHTTQLNRFSDIAAMELYKQGRRANYFDIIIRPCFKFFRDYFFFLGFLDGFFGFVACINTSHYTFMKYVKLKMLQQNK